METLLLAKSPAMGDRFLAGFSLMEGSPLHEVRVFSGCSGVATCVAVNSAGTRGAVGTSRGEVLLCDLNSKGDPVVLHIHDKSVQALCFSPDGRTLASSSEDGPLCLLDANSGAKVSELKRSKGEDEEQDFTDTARCLRFSKNGTRLMALGDELRVWNLTSAKLETRIKLRVKTDSPFYWDEAKGLLYMGTWDHGLVTVSTVDGSLIESRKWHEKHIHGVDVPGDDIVTAGCDGMVCIGKLSEAQPRAVFRFNDARFRAPLFLDRSRIVVATDSADLYEITRMREDGFIGFLLLPELYLAILFSVLMLREALIGRRSSS
ncbi:MAG TPA: hypothetical protein VKX17_14460 [Planctomycetota bacterium]|nr:hypothetical protein [Planctomycetota bacterium]